MAPPGDTPVNGAREPDDADMPASSTVPAGGASPAPRGPKRFYTTVTIEPATDGGFAVLLDGRAVKTPKKARLGLPTMALAEAIAGEWSAQGTHIDPVTMPLTRLANTALDAVTPAIEAVRADIVRFAASDAIAYRCDEPAALVERQAAYWDPVLAWAADRHGACFATTTAILPLEQPQAALDAIAGAVSTLDPFETTAVHVMTTLTGSALLALSVADRALTVQAAWTAAHVDEDWQIERWGADAEATARRAARWQEMASAAKLLETLR